MNTPKIPLEFSTPGYSRRQREASLHKLRHVENNEPMRRQMTLNFSKYSTTPLSLRLRVPGETPLVSSRVLSCRPAQFVAQVISKI